jgi:Mrp family chromosome partitioning ATPase/capsular polysaccharide biosynthesis protein
VELQHYLDIVKRQKWLIVEAVVIVAVVAGLLSSLKTPVYQTSARVLLRPNDPNEQLYPGYSVSLYSDPDRYVSAQLDIIQSEGVARDAAKALKSTGDPKALLGEMSASQSGTSDVINITGSSIDPARAKAVANAFANAYIENRRQFAVASLKRAYDDIDKRLQDLQAKIADYDRQIGDGGLQPGATANSVPSGAPATGISNPNPAPNIQGPTGTGLNDGAQPTTDNTLKAARYAAATQYQSLYYRQQELLVDMNLKRGEAELVSEADTPTVPVSPKPKRDAMLGGFLGLLLGLGVAFLREQIDDRIRTREELENEIGLPVLAELPQDALAANEPNRLAVLEQPLGGLAEATRSLRTSVNFLAIEQPLRRIVVTSPGPGDGKSLVAASLAVAYAQAGHSTVLVSADLRKPRLSAMFGGGHTSKGLTGVLADLAANPLPKPTSATHTNGNGNGNGKKVAATDAYEPVIASEIVQTALEATGVENLYLLTAGPTPPNSAELLGSSRMTEVLTELSRIADVVILDTPPLLAVTDAAVLATKVDGILLVAAMDETHRGALRRAKAALEGSPARLLGVVLNKVEGRHGYYSYGYGGYYGRPDDTAKKSKKRGRKADKALETADHR